MMIHQSMGSANPDVERLIREMLSENARFERELRSAHRESLVCPVNIVIPAYADNEAETVHGFSRNISVTGVCVLSESDICVGQRAVLEVYRLNSTDASRVRAECRWSKPFGHQFYASGWQFESVARD